MEHRRHGSIFLFHFIQKKILMPSTAQPNWLPTGYFLDWLWIILYFFCWSCSSLCK